MHDPLPRAEARTPAPRTSSDWGDGLCCVSLAVAALSAAAILAGWLWQMPPLR